MPLIPITDATDARVDHYRGLTDAALRRHVDAVDGIYMAESDTVLARAVAAGHRVISVLTLPSRLDRVAIALGHAAADAEIPVYVAGADIVETIAGFDVHRGVLAAVQRPRESDAAAVLAGARTVIVAEDIVDHANLGTLFRNGAALGADAVLLTPRCADPYYRRAVRVSMGTVFALPWARLPEWPEATDLLHGAGFRIVALALRDDAVTLDVFQPVERVALLVGSEGPGLTDAALAIADDTVVIPMSRGVDSLNVATAAALALWAVRDR